MLKKGKGNLSTVQTIFVFDECRQLIQEELSNKNTAFEYLRYSFASLPDSSTTFAVFLDTISLSLQRSETPPEIRDPSFRFFTTKVLIQSYYELLTWDVKCGSLLKWVPIRKKFENQDLKEREKQIQMESGSLYQKLFNSIEKPGDFFKEQIRFGRPAWSIYEEEEVSVVDLATAKILGGVEFRSNQFQMEEESYLSVLSCRLCLTVTPGSVLSSNLIGNYCAICVYLSGNEIVPLYCSDPCLMEGAAQAMYTSKFDFKRALAVLRNYMKQGVVSAGFRGELISKILLLIAMDTALQSKSQIDNCKSKYTRAITVRDYLKALFGSAYESILEAQNAQMMSSLQDGLVFFNAFYYCDKTPTKETMVEYLSRGLAIVCKEGQAGCDLIIPILIKKRLSYILVQVKNYNASDPYYSGGWKSLTSSSCNIPPVAKNTPYLGLWLSLGYKTPRLVDLRYSPHVIVQKTNERQRSKKKAQTVYGSRSSNWPLSIPFRLTPKSHEAFVGNLEPNQFLIGAFGVDHSLYPSLHEDEVDLLKGLVVSKTPMSEVKKDSKGFVETVTRPMLVSYDSKAGAQV